MTTGGTGSDRFTRKQIGAVAVVAVIVLSLTMPVVGQLITNSLAVSGTAVVQTNTGVTVKTTDTGGDMQFGNIFPSNSEVELVTANGNVTVSGAGTADVTVDNIEGTWTNTSSLSVASNDVTFDPGDKPSAGVGGDADTFDFRDPTVDDGTPDFVYSGASGTTDVTVHGLPASTYVRAVESSTGAFLAEDTTDSNGVAEFTGMTNSEHVVLIQTDSGGPTLSNPSPQSTQNTFPTTLSIDVDDPDFGSGESVDVEFFLDGVSQGTDTLTSSGTASVSISSPSAGDHDVKAVATDRDGNTQEFTWEFGAPNELEIRDMQNRTLIDYNTVEVTFYEGDTIINKSTSDGTVSLENLPIDGDIVVRATTDDYQNSNVIIEDLAEQDEVYMLKSSAPKHTVTFTLQDRTGGTFEGNNATLFIQRPYDISTELQWDTIHADEFGAAGVTADLEQDQRYRLIVKNDQGDTRVVGSYTSEQDETVPLTVGEVVAVPSDRELEYQWNATYLNESTNYVQFQYNDTANLTTSVSVRIYERGNESNVLFSNTTYGGPLGSFVITQPVPSNEEEAEWVVEVVGIRSGNNIAINEPVGPTMTVLTAMPGWLKATISIGSIIVVAGLFSQLNGRVGGLVTACLGGMWWFTGFLPQETGVGVVVLALMVAGMMFVNDSRGGALG